MDKPVYTLTGPNGGTKTLEIGEVEKLLSGKGALGMMLERQMNLQRKVFHSGNGPDWENLDLETRCALMKEFVYQCTEEFHEMNRELPYMKPWKQYEASLNMTGTQIAEYEHRARAEFVDAWHFMLNMANLLKFTEQTLEEAYNEKNKVNHKRQEEKY